MSDIKILLLNASPHHEGSVARMLAALADEAQAKGDHTMTVNICGLHVRPCTGCMVCRSTGECVLPHDDAQRILEMIRCCDMLVVGAPTYWGNMPGTLKLLFDRMVYGLMREGDSAYPRPLLKGKRAMIVTGCNTPWPFNILFGQSRGCVNAIKEVLKWGGFKIVTAIQRGGLRKRPITDKDLSGLRRRMASALKSMH